MELDVIKPLRHLMSVEFASMNISKRDVYLMDINSSKLLKPINCKI